MELNIKFWVEWKVLCNHNDKEKLDLNSILV